MAKEPALKSATSTESSSTTVLIAEAPIKDPLGIKRN